MESTSTNAILRPLGAGAWLAAAADGFSSILFESLHETNEQATKAAMAKLQIRFFFFILSFVVWCSWFFFHGKWLLALLAVLVDDAVDASVTHGLAVVDVLRGERAIFLDDDLHTEQHHGYGCYHQAYNEQSCHVFVFFAQKETLPRKWEQKLRHLFCIPLGLHYLCKQSRLLPFTCGICAWAVQR